MVNSAKRTVFRLEHPARLILINAHSSYLELKNNGTDSSKCMWCSSTKPHEHDILGKIKFTGSKEKSYLLSMVEKVKIKNKNGLEITIANNDAEAENKIKVSQENSDGDEVLNLASSKSKVTHWATQEVANEAEGARYLARQLINQNGNLTCASIKYGDRRHVLSSTPKSVLKPKVGSNCEKCLNNQFSSLTEMQLHFMNVHQYNLQLKDITLVPPNGGDIDALEEESKSFVCDHCPVEFDSDEKKIEHMNEVHGERQCPKCLQHFKTNLTFRKHTCSLIRDSKLDRKHPCHLCPKSFLKAPHLRAHLQTHMGAKLYACEICDKRYASAFSLKTHRVNTHGVGGVKPKCPHCSRTFCNNTFLRRHILESHEKDSRRSCKICGAFYLRKDKLEAHMNTHGNTEKVKSCKLCSKSYSSQELLQEHLRTVHGILPWNKVQVCQVSSKPHELNEQELDDDWQLKCKYCEQAMEKGEMENHLRFSHGVMPITSSEQFTISEAAEALLKTLTPQPDYLLRSLTPLPMETLDELIMDSALSKD